jgi:hypothetical protein
VRCLRVELCCSEERQSIKIFLVEQWVNEKDLLDRDLCCFISCLVKKQVFVFVYETFEIVKTETIKTM